MKVKLYKKLIKRICRSMHISRKQLFSRDFSPMMLFKYKYSLERHKWQRDRSCLVVIDSKSHVLNEIWEYSDLDFEYTRKHWKHSHWRLFVQVNLDLGYSIEDIVDKIVNFKRNKKTIA